MKRFIFFFMMIPGLLASSLYAHEMDQQERIRAHGIACAL